jgi:phospholipase C
MSRLRWAFVSLAALAVAAVTVAGAAGGKKGDENAKKLDKIQHIVVVYEENHSFDNLYGGWEGVNGRDNADAARTNQIAQNGLLYKCLLQNDVNLTSPPQPAAPQPADCPSTTSQDTTTGTPFTSHFPNAPFSIEAFIPEDARTCPQPGVFAAHGLTPSPTNLSGGCTEDIVHRFYQEQYQIHGGKQDLYVTGSDALGLTMGYYDTTQLPIYTYLHDKGHPHYLIADDFFQGAFGGSFLNHQWLIAAAAPPWAGMPAAQHAIVDSNGMPNNYALYHATGPVADPAGTATCASLPVTKPDLACGDYAINTIQPTYQPHGGGPQLPPQLGMTIGDERSRAESQSKVASPSVRRPASSGDPVEPG